MGAEFLLTEPVYAEPEAAPAPAPALPRLKQLSDGSYEIPAGHSMGECFPEYFKRMEELDSALGERAVVARVLAGKGLGSKAIRYRDCCRFGFKRICTVNPLEHRFYSLIRCGLRFCPDCAPKLYGQLFNRYAGPLRAFLKGQGFRQGYTLALLTLTIRATGEAPTAEGIRAFNRAIRRLFKRLMRRLGIGAKDFGLLWVDEFGAEHEHGAGGFNPHAHGLYYGPYLEWSMVRDLWKEMTGNTGVFLKEMNQWKKQDAEKAVVCALKYMLKYVSKMSAKSPERLAIFEAAFNGVRRVHSMGAFYRLQKVAVGDDDLRQSHDEGGCPECGGKFYLVKKSDFISPLSLAVLRADGFVDLDAARREAGRRRVLGGVRDGP